MNQFNLNDNNNNTVAMALCEIAQCERHRLLKNCCGTDGVLTGREPLRLSSDEEDSSSSSSCHVKHVHTAADAMRHWEEKNPRLTSSGRHVSRVEYICNRLNIPPPPPPSPLAKTGEKKTLQTDYSSSCSGPDVLTCYLLCLLCQYNVPRDLLTVILLMLPSAWFVADIWVCPTKWLMMTIPSHRMDDAVLCIDDSGPPRSSSSIYDAQGGVCSATYTLRKDCGECIQFMFPHSLALHLESYSVCWDNMVAYEMKWPWTLPELSFEVHNSPVEKEESRRRRRRRGEQQFTTYPGPWLMPDDSPSHRHTITLNVKIRGGYGNDNNASFCAFPTTLAASCAPTLWSRNADFPIHFPYITEQPLTNADWNEHTKSTLIELDINCCLLYVACVLYYSNDHNNNNNTRRRVLDMHEVASLIQHVAIITTYNHNNVVLQERSILDAAVNLDPNAPGLLILSLGSWPRDPWSVPDVSYLGKVYLQLTWRLPRIIPPPGDRRNLVVCAKAQLGTILRVHDGFLGYPVI